MRLQIDNLWKYVMRGEDISMEIRLFRLISLMIALISILLVVPVNLLLGLSPVLNLVIGLYGLVALYLHTRSYSGRHPYKSFYFMTLLVLGISWFLNGGSTGSIGYFYFAVILYPLIFFRRQTLLFMLLLFLLGINAMFLVEYFHPSLVIPFHSSSDRLFDLLSGYFFSAMAIAMVFWVVISSLERELEERRQTDFALKKSEEQFRSFVENANDIVFSLTTEGVFSYVSPNWKDTFGYSVDETIGKPFTGFVHPDDVAACYAFLKLVLEAGDRQGEVEYRVHHRNGTWVWYSAKGSMRPDPECNEPAFLGIGRNITERKRAEESLQKKDADIEQFLYTVSHDLRTPLVTVKTFMGYLEKDMAEGKKEHLAQDIMYIHSAADKMKLMLDELLEFSRIDRVEALPVRVSFLDVLSETLEDLAGVIRESKAEIHLPETDIELFGEPPRFTQILQNLIENAIKYRQGENAPRIEIGVRQYLEETVFFVKDDGVGVDSEYLTKIFGIFEKLDPKSSGVGLGLSMVQRIVEKYGGRIWVESEGDCKGACFYFTLPGAVIKS